MFEKHQASSGHRFLMDIAVAEVKADKFVSGAEANHAIVPFLMMNTIGVCQDKVDKSTLRSALRELGSGSIRAGRQKRAGGTVRWDEIEELLFDPYDPTDVLGNPPSTVSIVSSPRAEDERDEEVRLSDLKEYRFKASSDSPLPLPPSPILRFYCSVVLLLVVAS